SAARLSFAPKNMCKSVELWEINPKSNKLLISSIAVAADGPSSEATWRIRGFSSTWGPNALIRLCVTYMSRPMRGRQSNAHNLRNLPVVVGIEGPVAHYTHAHRRLGVVAVSVHVDVDLVDFIRRTSVVSNAMHRLWETICRGQRSSSPQISHGCFRLGGTMCAPLRTDGIV